MNILHQFKHITTFVFEIEGVLTPAQVLVLENGELLRLIDIKDSYALRLAIKSDFRVVFVSSGKPEGVATWLNKSGINWVFLELANKKKKMEEWVREQGVNWGEVLFMGYDLPDSALLKMAGMSCSPIDSVEEIKQISKYVSSFKGGGGCIRDVIEKVMKLNGTWISTSDEFGINL
jgi:3-deoxy-D-manno-octulosonate 8-phosphate phosphatase (KDO 8-P phosphatase)